MSTPVPLVDFSWIVLYGKAQMGEVWDHPNRKKFGQVLEGCIRAKEGSAGSVGLQRAVAHHISAKIFVRQCSLIIGWFGKTLG
jgi:hypothetical protein